MKNGFVEEYLEAAVRVAVARDSYVRALDDLLQLEDPAPHSLAHEEAKKRCRKAMKVASRIAVGVAMPRTIEDV